jgi:hypothetical protein
MALEDIARKERKVLNRSTKKHLCSWFLYSFGLMLTLTGKVFGTKEPEENIE